jgi:hypothetical protein
VLLLELPLLLEHHLLLLELPLLLVHLLHLS